MTLIKIDRNQLERHWRALAQLEQDVEHSVAILATGQTHHHPVARADHVEVGNRLSDQPAQAFVELVGLETGLFLGTHQRTIPVTRCEFSAIS